MANRKDTDDGAAPESMRKEHGFNFSFFRRLWRLHEFLFPAVTSASTGFSCLVLLLSLSEEIVAYFVGLIPSAYYVVLGEKNLDGFIQQTLKSISIILGMVMIRSVKKFITQFLNLTWRQYLTKHIHRLYYTGITYYQLNVMDRFIDNPDQRIASDISIMCQIYSTVAVTVIVSPFTISFYSYRAYTSTGWVGPTACFLFFAIGTAVNKLLMSPIVAWVIKQDRKEGDFRYKHTQIRAHAESLAFLKGETLELHKSNQKLDLLIDTQKSLYRRQFFLELAVQSFEYLGSILSYLALAVPIFSGQYDDLSPTDLSALISQNAFVCIYLIFSFSTLVGLSSDVTKLAGVTHRIAELVERLEQFNNDSNERFQRENRALQRVVVDEKDAKEDDIGVQEERWWLQLDMASLRPPGKAEELVKDLTLHLKVGENVLITGSSSAGKTSILRVLRGLWKLTRGSIIISPNYCHNQSNEQRQTMFFLPQKPYLTEGTLRDQLTYPLTCGSGEITQLNDNEETDRLIEYLHVMRLDDLLKRTGGLDHPVDWNWYDVMSPGEMQRVSFIRLLHHRPAVAFLDEATSALDEEMEHVLYQAAARLDITIVSIGHRPSLRAYHHRELRLCGDGRWCWENFRRNHSLT